MRESEELEARKVEEEEQGKGEVGRKGDETRGREERR